MTDVQDVFMTAPPLCRRSLLVLAATAVLPVTALSPACADSAAVAPVQQLIDGLTRVMKAGRTVPFSQRFDMLAPVIDRTLDLGAILKASVGAAWDNLPQDQQATLLEAFRRYGKGIDPKAKLNYCDCAVYALAKAMNAPLLFKGNDFVATDLIAAMA